MPTPPTPLEEALKQLTDRDRESGASISSSNTCSNPHILSAEEWLNRNDKIDPNDIIFGTPENPFVTRQTKNIIEGPEKSFKTTFLLAPCIGLSTGQTVYPRMVVLKPQIVLYLHGELGDWQIQDRTMWAQKEHRLRRPLDNLFQGRDTKMHLINPAGQELIKKTVREFAPLDVVVFDPLQQFITEYDESTFKEMSIATAFMDSLIEEFGVTIMLVAHTGKDTKKGVRGTSLFAGWRDTLFRLKRENGNKLKVEVKPRWGSADFDFHLQFENNTMQPVEQEFRHQTGVIQDVVRKAGGECPIETIIDVLILDEKKTTGKPKSREACLKAVTRAKEAGAIRIKGNVASLPELQFF